MKRIFGLTAGTDREGGQTLILVALSMVVLVGFLGLAVDIGNLRNIEHQLQGDADAAALAGAIQITYCTVSDCTNLQTAAQNAVIENGIAVSNSNTKASCSYPTDKPGTGPVLIVNNGPCLLGSTKADPNYEDSKTVEALLVNDVPLYFSGALGIGPLRLSARAEAGLGNPNKCVYAIPSPSGNPASVEVGSGGQFSAPCGVQDDGNLTDTKGKTNGSCNGSHITASDGVDVAGSACNSNQMNPTPVTSAPSVPNPLAYLSSDVPNVTSCQSAYAGNKTPGTGINLNSLLPGTTYCGLEISSGDTLTLVPDSNGDPFIFTGNLTIDGQATVTGSGVTLYFSSGTLNVTSTNSTVNLSAPLNTCSTLSSGLGAILIWQASTNNSTFYLRDGLKSTYEGAIYLPDGTIDDTGGSNLGVYTFMVANTIILGDGGQTNVGMDYSSLSCGSPIKDGTSVLVE